MFVLNVIGKGAVPSRFAKLSLGPAVILSEGFAFDLPLAVADAALLAQARVLAPAWDINLIATAHRRKKLLVADMDSTIVNVECLDELAALAGLKHEIAAITDKSMKGEVPFEASFRERVRMLKGLPLSALEQTYAQKVRLNPGAKALIATMRAHGAKTFLVSGGFTYFTDKVAEAAGFDGAHGNRPLDDGKVLTGELAEPLLGRDGKHRVLEEEAARLHIGLEECLAVGDGANDLAMIKAAGLGVGWHAKPVVAAIADAVIAHNDLKAILYLQGYADSEIANPE